MMASSELESMQVEAVKQAEATKHYMKPQQVADMLGKSVDWVRRKAADGTLPHKYIGRDLRFIPSDVHKWVEEQTLAKQDPARSAPKASKRKAGGRH